MKRKIVVVLLIMLWVINIHSQQQEYPLVSVPPANEKGIPEGWILSGSNPFDYAVGVDLSESYSGFSSAYLKSISSKPVGFVTLVQNFKANDYISKRIKITAQLKTRYVAGWCSLWMQVNDAAGKLLAFDDMRDRPLIGSMEWTQVEIVLDIPLKSDEISFGVFLRGKGQAWFDDIKIAIVGEEVPVTDILKNKVEIYSPINLDFED